MVKLKSMRVLRRLKQFALPGLAVLLLGAISTQSLLALPYGAGSYGTCQYSTCGITLTSSGTVNLGVIPTADGVYTTASDSVSVSTSNSTGYTLSLRDSDTNTSLVNGANVMTASGGTSALPLALELNTWGYRVDGLAAFGAGPTSAQNNASASSYTFAGAPASNQTSHTLKTAASAADPPQVTTVWYGVRVDATKPSGTYSGQVTYTAVTND